MFVADAAVFAKLLSDFVVEEALMPGVTLTSGRYTADWSDEDIVGLLAVARDVDADPLHLASCWMSESGLHPYAHNPHGNAVGLFQVIPPTLRGLGFFGDWSDFASLSIGEQLKWARRYYARHRGRLVSPGACYLATFLPALMAHAAEPLFVLCSTTLHPEWYGPNRATFDPDGRGYITVGDLTRRVEAVTRGPRWDEFASRVRDAAQDAPTLPELPDGEDAV
jgi:hypothetical protein